MNDEPLGLVRYDTMRRAIIAAHTVDEVKDIRDKAAALEFYARQAQNDEDERRCREIRQRAEREFARRYGAGEKAKAGRPPHNRSSAATDYEEGPKTLADYGVTKDQSSDWQRVASLSDDEFEAAIAQGASTSNMVEMAKLNERGGPVAPPETPVSSDALWLWGELDRMDRKAWLGRDPFQFLETMTPIMRDDVFRLAPRAASFFSRFAKTEQDDDSRRS